MSDSNQELRTPIVSVLGHVDHGKTTLLDEIRGSAVVEGEAGAITQHIGSTMVPIDVIEQLCEDILPPKIEIPGLLFIDTPGHHAFTTLRSRGGALSDIAILVIDVNDGFQPQTREAVGILDQYETPFVVAANKVDRVPGWRPNPGATFQESYAEQSDRAQGDLDQKIYELIGDLHDEGFNGDRYDRVKNFRKNIGVVPISAETGEGLAELLMVLVGLAQSYLKEDLELHATGPGLGTVVEVKEARGFGTTVDILLYDGVLEVGDEIVVGGKHKPIVTEVRALLKPGEMSEIRVEKEFEKVDRVTAADGIKVAAPDLDEAMAGAPIKVVDDRGLETVKDEVEEEMQERGVEVENQGIVVKADTLGSVEALGKTLDEAEISVKKATEGTVAKRDVVDAETSDERKNRVIMAFNVDVLEDAREYAQESLVKIFEGDVIYKLVEEYEEWTEGLESKRAEKVFESVVMPSKIRLLPDHTFRQNDPAVVGVEVVSGTLEKNVSVEKEGNVVGEVKGIQRQGEDIDEANLGDQVSVAIDGPTMGRQIKEGDHLYTRLPEKHAKILESELYESLDEPEREALDEYLERKREDSPFWAR
ncbi:MAG: translation initiation factor IF-2 [Halobacteria archaeon]